MQRNNALFTGGCIGLKDVDQGATGRQLKIFSGIKLLDDSAFCRMRRRRNFFLRSLAMGREGN